MKKWARGTTQLSRNLLLGAGEDLPFLHTCTESPVWRYLFPILHAARVSETPEGSQWTMERAWPYYQPRSKPPVPLFFLSKCGDPTSPSHPKPVYYTLQFAKNMHICFLLFSAALHGMRDLSSLISDQPGSLQWKGRVLVTGPPTKSPY